MNDSVRRMRMQPINAAAPGGNSDRLRNRDLFAVIKNHEVLMDMNALAFLRIAGNPAVLLAAGLFRITEDRSGLIARPECAEDRSPTAGGGNPL